MEGSPKPDVDDQHQQSFPLLPCTICGRTFKPESLEKHTKICEKNAVNKRKVFDSTKQRLNGTDIVEFMRESANRLVEPETKTDNADCVITYVTKPPPKTQASVVGGSGGTSGGSGGTGGGSSGSGGGSSGSAGARQSVSAASKTFDKCPHCERTFCVKAYDRHVEWCKTQTTRSRLSPDAKKATEKLFARIKYQAPLARSNRRKSAAEGQGDMPCKSEASGRCPKTASSTEVSFLRRQMDVEIAALQSTQSDTHVNREICHAERPKNLYTLTERVMKHNCEVPRWVEAKTKFSKFCHECGTKFSVAEAKYCCECGARRLVIIKQ